MTRRDQIDLRSPVAAFRAILIGVCGLLASLPDAEHGALIPLAALVVLAWAVYRAPLSSPQRVRIALVEALVAGGAVPLSGGMSSPMLPYLLAPALALGLHAGPRAVLTGGGLAALGLGVARAAVDGHDAVQDFAVVAAQWLLLGLAVGLVATWARRLSTTQEPEDRYAEARLLLQRLRTVTGHLPGGLDAEGTAEALLEEAARLAPNYRSAVLVQTVQDGALVPLAVRGTTRVPWRTPLSSPGPLQDAWLSRSAVVQRHPPQARGRRAGDALAVIPLAGSEATFGLLVMESRDEDAFGDEAVRAVVEAAGPVALQLETALLFDEVRSIATAEERSRLAREMHDGVAQELAFLGYRLDELRLLAAKAEPELGERVADLRKDVTDLISNLRLSITDLKTSVSRDRGLGAALGAYIRAVGAGRRLTVHLSLQESPFRLPADREVALFQLAQTVAQDVRVQGRAENLWVTLSVDPPYARLLVEHDGDPLDAGADLTEIRSTLDRLGGSLTTAPRERGGVCVEAVFEGGEHGDQRAAG